MKFAVMEEIIRAKLSQHPYIQKKLLQTGTREIIEDSPKDSFWGWGPNKDGHNHLGKIWMKLREESHKHHQSSKFQLRQPRLTSARRVPEPQHIKLMQETVDVVDENDAILYQLPKKEACEEKEVFHRIAAVFVFLPDGKLIVQHRVKDGLLDHSAAGHVHSGETYEEASKRELSEELGLRKSLQSISKILPFKDFGIQYRHHFFLSETTIQSLDELTPSLDEVQDLVPMEIVDIVSDMNKHPEKYTLGFKFTLSSYIQNKSLNYPPIALK